jgi:hypothetical protein
VVLKGGILFADARQRIDKLFVYVTIHERGTILLQGTVRIPGRAARALRFKTVRRTLDPHILRKVRLLLARPALRAVKRRLRRGRKIQARVKLTAVGKTGTRQTARRTIRLRP